MPSARKAFSRQIEAAGLDLRVKPYAGELKKAQKSPSALDGLLPAALVLGAVGTRRKKGRYLFEVLIVTDTPALDRAEAQDDATEKAEALAHFLTERPGRRWKGKDGTGYRTEYGSGSEGVQWETLAVTTSFAIVRLAVEVAEV